MAANVMPNVMQQGGQWLMDQFQGLSNAVTAQRDRIAANRARLSAIRANVAAVRDPKERAKVEAFVRSASDRQSLIERTYSALGSKFVAFTSAARSWLSAHGFLRQAGLNGLGIVPAAAIVPVTLVSAAVFVGALVAALKAMNDPHTKALDVQARLLDARLKGQISEQEYSSGVAAAEHAADKAKPTPEDPLGLANLLEKALPVLVVVGVLMFAPRILDAVGGRRRAA